jgi:hypothetical protein
MIKRILQFIFLIIAGIVIGWREWTAVIQANREITEPTDLTIGTETMVLNNWNHYQEVGRNTETASIFLVLVGSVFLTFVVLGLVKTYIKLSSPNSV